MTLALRRSLQVDVLDHRGAFASLEAAWSSLVQRRGGVAAGPFSEPVWHAVTAASLCRTPRSLRVLVAHEDGELRGALPLLVEDRLLAGMPARVLRSLSDDHSQRFDLAAADDDAVAALWQQLRSDESWDVLELRDVAEGSRACGLLQELARAEGFPTSTWASQRSPYLPLPATEKELEAQLGAKFRSNLRRRKKNLVKEVGEVQLERITSARDGDLDAALDEGLALEQSGWKGQGGTAIACDPVMRMRYRSLVRTFCRRGELSLHFLRAGGRRVAFHLAIEAGGVYYLFKPGFDEALRKHGLGHLLTWEVARALVERGVHELDFLGDDMPWKREWTALVRPHHWLYVYRPSLRGRALHAWKTRAVPALKHAAARIEIRLGAVPRPRSTNDTDT